MRSRVPDETGPTGGPAFTDVLGMLESWEDDAITVRRRDGTLVQVETALIVSGKAIPPEPKRRRRGDSSSESDDSAG